MRKRTTITGFLVAALSAAAFAGCGREQAGENLSAQEEQAPAAGSEAATVALVNRVCPIMGGKAKSTVTTQWNEQTVGFCCAECIPEWKELSDDERAAKLTAAEADAAGEDAGEPADQHDGSDDAA